MQQLALIFSVNGINATASSRDANFFFECEGRQVPGVGQPIGFGPSPALLVGEVSSDAEAVVVSLKNDGRFCVGRLGHDSSQDPAFVSLVSAYRNAGWIDGCSEVARSYFKRCAVLRAEESRVAGHINWRSILGEPTPVDELCGGFSNFVTDNPRFREYIAGRVFGWIGASSRTSQIDALLEELFRQRDLTSEEMFCWISSTEGRHFGDYVEDLPLNKQVAYVVENADHFCNSAVAYCDPSHLGTLRSTIEVKRKTKNAGMAFPEKETDFVNGDPFKNIRSGTARKRG